VVCVPRQSALRKIFTKVGEWDNHRGKEEVVLMDLMEAITGRRSIRKYNPDPVPHEALEKVLAAVRWAPSWANTQCCEVVVAKDPRVKSELAATLPQTNPALRSMTDAPLVLVLCAKKGTSGFYKGQAATVKGDWLMFDTGLAMQNLCLAAHALGLGTVVVGMFDHKKAEQILGVPEGVEVVAMTPVGYPAGGGGTSKRREISDFVFYDSYPGKE
jgi:nitroreductase